jgi:imidazoleglycerol-phosphate dehydratase
MNLTLDEEKAYLLFIYHYIGSNIGIIMERKAIVTRTTKETDISISLELDSVQESNIKSGIPFLDHMLHAVAKHGRIYLELCCKGDYEIDDHHSVEDIGIVLGKALKKALGTKAGIQRFGFSSIPMDDALCQVSLDLSGRPYFVYTGEDLKGYINQYSEELTREFFYAVAVHAEMNLHINLLYGTNRHHIHEALYKAFGVALYRAFSYDDILEGKIPSTKGTI